jgi:hypothetical protein
MAIDNILISRQIDRLYPYGALSSLDREGKIKALIKAWSDVNSDPSEVAYEKLETTFSMVCFCADLPCRKKLNTIFVDGVKKLDEEGGLYPFPELVEDENGSSIEKSLPGNLAFYVILNTFTKNQLELRTGAIKREGFDINFVRGESTLLRISCAVLDLLQVTLLLERGADVRMSSPLTAVVKPLPSKNHPVQLDIVKALIGKGAPVLDRFAGFSLLDLAEGKDMPQANWPEGYSINGDLVALLKQSWLTEQINTLNKSMWEIVLSSRLRESSPFFQMEMCLIKKIAAYVRNYIYNEA